MATDKLVQAVEQATSSESLIQATWALAAAREATAIPKLIEVLGYNNPGAAVAAVEGLVWLGDAAVPVILNNIDSYDYGARAWSIRALSRIGHPQALEILLESAKTDFALSVRRAAAKGLGSVRWSLFATDAEMKAAQAKTLATLQQVYQDPEWVVRYAAIVGLQTLAENQPDYKAQIVEYFQQIAATETELAVKARIQKAIYRLGSP